MKHFHCNGCHRSFLAASQEELDEQPAEHKLPDEAGAKLCTYCGSERIYSFGLAGTYVYLSQAQAQKLIEKCAMQDAVYLTPKQPAKAS